VPSTEAKPEHPLWVRCAGCGSSWVGLYLPMRLTKVGRFMNMVCPVCAGGADQIFLAEPPAEGAPNA